MEAELKRELGRPDTEGGRALPLAGVAGAWRVEAGHVDLFAVSSDEGSDAARPRRHLETLVAGDLIFGLGETGADAARPEAARELGATTFAIVGRAHSRLSPVPAERLHRWASEPHRRAALAEALDRWLLALLGSGSLPPIPAGATPLQRGRTARLETSQAAFPAGGGVVWLRAPEGRLLLLGEPGSAIPAGLSIPIAGGLWALNAGPEGELVGEETADALHRGDAWTGLAAYHALILRYLELQARRESEHERRRLDRRVEDDRRKMHAANQRLANVLDRAEGGAVGDSADEPLLAACQLVGAEQGLRFRLPRRAPGDTREYSATDIFHASKIGYRRVTLRGRWWRRDNGPLLAFRDTGETDPGPVALLAKSPRRYELVDPVTGRREVVDGTVAAQLESGAYMCYTPLPRRALNVWDLLRAVVRGRRRDLATVVAASALAGIVALLVPLATAAIVNRAIPDGDRLHVAYLALAVILGGVGTALFQITRSVAVLRLAGHVDRSLQAAIWERLVALPVSFFRRFTVGDLEARSTGIDAIRDLLTGDAITSLIAVVFSTSSFVILFYYSWRLALVATALVLLLGAATTLVAMLQLGHQRRLYHLRGMTASLVFTLLTGITKLRASGAEQRAYAVWADRFAEQRRETYSVQRLSGALAVISAVYGVLASVVLFAFVGLVSQLSIGDFLAFIAAFGQFQAAALAAIAVIANALAVMPIYERMKPILETVPESDETKMEAGRLNGRIEISHVSFRYHGDGPLVLDDVSLEVDAGEMVALVGPSGSGKSTCVRLILGFDEPESGTILFDGKDLASLDVQSVRRQIGVVLQNSQPLGGDVFSNIVGNLNLTLDDAWRAARMVALEEDIEAMPMGMHTFLAQQGLTFSRGQRQRLMIARAIVNRPRILLLDEATNALDNRTQAIVGSSLEKLDASRLIVAHRLSTIINADRIYVLDAGKIVEVGAYDELMAKNGLFARMAKRQLV